MRRVIMTAAVLLICSADAHAQEVRSLEVRDQPVGDVLLSLGKLYGASIVPDQTVSGTTSYYFSEPNLETALAMFLPSLGCYFWKDEDLYRVSRLRVRPQPGARSFDVDANEVPVSLVIARVSEATGAPILYRAPGNLEITLHAKGLSIPDLLELITLQFPQLSVLEQSRGYLLLDKRAQDSTVGTSIRSEFARHYIHKSGEEYSIDSPATAFKNLLSALFASAGREYVFIGKNNPTLHPLNLNGRSFEAMVELLLDLGGSGADEVNGTYYIYDLAADRPLGKLQHTVVVPLQHLSVENLPELLPSNLSRSDHFRLDKRTNSVILSGKSSEITLIRSYLSALDRPTQNVSYRRFDLHYLSAMKLLTILPVEFSRRNPLTVPGSQSIVVSLTKAEEHRLREYIASVDRPPESRPVKLRYVRVSDLIEHLPPGITKDDIIATPDPCRFFFVGGEEKQNLLRKRLQDFDRPPRQIRYELVVVQYHEGSTANRELSLSNNLISKGDRNAVLGTIGRLLSLQFDFVSAFGYLFALRLNFDLAQARARVLADTTLNGISGETISFRNTETFRYRDTVVNPETGRLDPTGVVREITSGLTIEVGGWVSGDGLVTMDVTSSVSARGADTSGSATALPATSEKTVKTHVRTPSGTPVVIGGLKELTHDTRSDRIPFLGDLPLIGALFEKLQSGTQDTELAIYILPVVEEVTGPEQTEAETLLRAYHLLVEGADSD